ncbi:hypothetical protein [Thermofilum pendens]|uniref:Uncharacterized protein n=1 Tax=Thermofilum pendens (strain DSM 2475 / Hrk 5) TaxID=368408 RepID=A1RWT6_THEPD|nr:hypothetical protein [Thermofilum pendens]ABL77666.1 hypothetical protein Tpen_0256 [Thermofilum pendens Hrk 5]
MPWIGIGKKCLENEQEVAKYLEDSGVQVLKKFELEIEVDGEWIPFLVFEVLGFVEGLSEDLSRNFQCPTLESGPHLVLGEVSAKLWDEAVKVVFPDGGSRIIPVFTFDAFLDIRVPTKKVKGLKGQLILAGRVFELPLSKDDLLFIAKLDKKYLEKIEKAVAVYGLDKILSKEAQAELAGKPSKKSLSYEVDYESGMALVMLENKIQTIGIPRLAVLLAEEEMYRDIREIYGKISEELKEKMKEALLDYYEFRKLSGRSLKDLEELLKELGVEVK